jgi:5-(carboxyamino)imidazole ribonucleotide synthase
MVERAVPMRRELAALVARSPFGPGRRVAGGGDRAGARAVRAGAGPGAGPGRGRRAGRPAARPADRDRAGRHGLLAVELFEATARRLVVNELAMRPHNSGHWTIEGARTSQFEQHLRAVLDYPLGRHRAHRPAVVMANVLARPQAPGDEHRRALHHLFARAYRTCR